MTLSENAPESRPVKPLTKSLDAIATLREALEKRLAESKMAAVEMTAGASVPDMAAPTDSMPEPSREESVAMPLKPETVKKTVQKPMADEPPAGKPAAEKTPPETPPFKTFDAAEWPRIMYRIADRSQRLVQEFIERQKDAPFDLSAFDPAHLSEAFLELTNRILKDPERFADAQLALWQGYFQIWQSALTRLQGENAAPIVAPPPSDKRFAGKEWQNEWLFDFIKQTYLLTAQWVHGVVRKETENLDPKLAQKLNFYTRQMVDAASPSNFWLTNPDVLKTTLETGGENLIKGFENLLDDLERGHGQLRIRMTDTKAFRVGENLATTKGQVIYQNNLMQLIQYDPLTPNVHKTPLLIVPPWINKYYILDLQEKKSFIRYLVEQGHTVFCISWINPGPRHALVNFEDYMSEGVLAAMRVVRDVTGEDQINAVGYCMGGTLLATTLAYLSAAETAADLPKIVSATYLVTLVDFADPGDIGVFIDEDQIKLVEAQMAKIGYFDAATMATTFSLLRANDLVWSFVVNNYLLGREPFPFDILFWNGDSTNLPAVMQSFYLRKMYLTNQLVKPNALQMKGVPIDLTRIAVPSFLLATSEDHIAPWRSTYKATQIYKGPVRFVLAGSGHIAGVINPPAANKYGYWTNDAPCPADSEEWMQSATQNKGSWWPEWVRWLSNYAGEDIPARAVTGGLEPAPGSYVKAVAI